MKEADYINVQISTELRCAKAIVTIGLYLENEDIDKAYSLITKQIRRYEEKVRS